MVEGEEAVGAAHRQKTCEHHNGREVRAQSASVDGVCPVDAVAEDLEEGAE